MTETVLVRPRTGIILPGIPRTGASIPRELAEEWIANQLVVRLETAPRGSETIRPRKAKEK